MKKLLILLIILLIIVNLKTEDKEIRIRILASSNSYVDQNNKNIIKEILINNFKSYKYENLDNFLINNLDLIKEDIEKEIPKKLNISIKIEYLKTYFPSKSLNGNFIKAGYYQTLLITIGKGEGNNWWSLLYPEFFDIGYDDFGEIKVKSYFIEKFKTLKK